MVKEDVNALSTHSVNEEKGRVDPVKIMFIEQKLKRYGCGFIEETSAKVAAHNVKDMYKNRKYYTNRQTPSFIKNILNNYENK